MMGQREAAEAGTAAAARNFEGSESGRGSSVMKTKGSGSGRGSGAMKIRGSGIIASKTLQLFKSFYLSPTTSL